MFVPFKFTLLRLSGKHTANKKQVNVILSNILVGHGRGKVMVDGCRVHIPGMVTSDSREITSNATSKNIKNWMSEHEARHTMRETFLKHVRD